MTGFSAQQAAAQNTAQGDEGGGGDGSEPAPHAVPPAEQQVGVGRNTGRSGGKPGFQVASKDQRKAERAAHARRKLHPVLRKRDAPGLSQPSLGLIDGVHFPGRDLAGKLIHRRHPPQVGGTGGHVAHLAHLRRACAGKNAVGQHIDMELPQVEAGRHDLHGLLHPEHLCPVLQKGLTGRHNKIHDAAALFPVRIQFPLCHAVVSLKLA